MTGKPLVATVVQVTSTTIDTKVKEAIQSVVQLIKNKHLS
jgi:hypothetical protein